jgi:hypothetical protein
MRFVAVQGVDKQGLRGDTYRAVGPDRRPWTQSSGTPAGPGVGAATLIEGSAEPLLTIREVAATEGQYRHGLRLCNREAFPYVRVSGGIRVKMTDLDAYLTVNNPRR